MANIKGRIAALLEEAEKRNERKRQFKMLPSGDTPRVPPFIRWTPYVSFVTVIVLVLAELTGFAWAGRWVRPVTAGGIPVTMALFLIGGVSYLIYMSWKRRNS